MTITDDLRKQLESHVSAHNAEEEGSPLPGANPKPQAGGASKDAADETLEITLPNGAKQVVPRSELVKLWADKSGFEAMKTAAEEALAKNQGAAALAKAVDSMTDDQRDRFGQLLQNPAMLESFLSGQQQPAPKSTEKDSSDDEFLANLFGGEKKSSSGQKSPAPEVVELQARFDRIERVLATLATRESGRIEGEKQATHAQQVSRALDAFPVFKQNQTAREWAELTVRTMTASGGDIQSTAAQVAAMAQKMTGGSPPPMSRDPRGNTRRLLGEDEKAPTGDDLQNGHVADRLNQMLNRA